MSVYYEKSDCLKTKQKNLIMKTQRYWGDYYAMHGMAVFSEDIQKENEGYFRKRENSWQGNKVIPLRERKLSKLPTEKTCCIMSRKKSKPEERFLT